MLSLERASSSLPSGPSLRRGEPDGIHIQARERGRTPAEPSTFNTVVPNWSEGDQIPLGRKERAAMVGERLWKCRAHSDLTVELDAAQAVRERNRETLLGSGSKH